MALRVETARGELAIDRLTAPTAHGKAGDPTDYRTRVGERRAGDVGDEVIGDRGGLRIVRHARHIE